MKQNITERNFYHIYPLGMYGAPARNDYQQPAGDALRRLQQWVPYLAEKGFNAIYIGPLFESTAHGYDTVDYYHVDRRLGTNTDLKDLVRACHDKGIAVVLDAVLNHTGRDFFAFKDIQNHGELSKYRHWYRGVDFGKRSPAGDNFGYEGWADHYDLVKLDTANSEVREHLFGAIHCWIEEFGIDGLRLDAADVLEPSFREALAAFCRSVKSDFWLMGEVVHGDYRQWANPSMLDSVTNYEAYKGLWSSLNDRNFFEIAWTLNRQFGDEGIYRDLCLYNFVDNHDVNRAASTLIEAAHLYPLYLMLYTMPGIPSVYYGSEFGMRGERQKHSDADLRPALSSPRKREDLPPQNQPHPAADRLEEHISGLASLRRSFKALREGSYRQLHVSNEQFCYLRQKDSEQAVVVINSAATQQQVPYPAELNGSWTDILNGNTHIELDASGRGLTVESSWGRILVRQ